MAITKGLFTSTTKNWETPQELFDALDHEFGFTLDACATKNNAKCNKYFSPKQNGLSQEWTGTVWCNPPYGRQIGNWIRKALESSRNGATVVMLIPSRTDTAWFHAYILEKAEIRFLRGRLKFSGAKTNAPFPSMVVIFR